MQDATIDAPCGSVAIPKPPPITHLVLREAGTDEFNRLRTFYRANVTPALPAPSVTVLGRTLEQGRLLLVEPSDGGPILAATATFDFTPDGCRTYVGELSGTRVMPRLNGFGPLGMQRLLLGARLLSHAAAEGVVRPGFSNTLITIVKSDNHKSRANVLAAGFDDLPVRPGWMDDEEYAWNGSAAGDAWVYFIATDRTVHQAVDEMGRMGMLDGTVRLTRPDRDTGLPDTVDIRIELGDLVMARHDLLALLEERRASGLGPPPSEIHLA